LFIGHYSIAFAAKITAPKTSLGTYLIAALLLDLIWSFLMVIGFEKVTIDPGNTVVTPIAFVHYPISHSLIAVIGFATIFSLLYFSFKRYSKGALLIGAAVLSHFCLDAIVHRPDLPLFPGSTTHVGLGLWNSLWGSILLEGTLFGLGVVLYIKATRAKDRIGSYALWTMIIVLVLIYCMNLFGPPPPNAKTIAYSGLAQWLFVVWAYWVDRHRTAQPCDPNSH